MLPLILETSWNGFTTPNFERNESPITPSSSTFQFIFTIVVILYFGVPCVSYISLLLYGKFRSERVKTLPSAQSSAVDTTSETISSPLVEGAESNYERLSRDSENSSATSQTPPCSAMVSEEILLTFRDIRYSVTSKDKQQVELLKGIDGFLKPGSMTAIMGPSGCGKSTLLEVLSNRKKTGTIRGNIHLNGKPMDWQVFKQRSGFVMQSDCLLPRLTVRETFLYAADFRLSRNMSLAMKHERVARIISDLGLEKVADSRIGGEHTTSGGGLSGGQKRRVTIGIEMVSDPSMLFLDEPTSGLDAYGSLQVMKVLRNLADKGRTIMMTIHQPRADIFNLYDQLLLLKAGRTMYFGPINKILSYFQRIGYEGSISDKFNTAEFVVDLTHVEKQTELDEEAVSLVPGTNARQSTDVEACVVELNRKASYLSTRDLLQSVDLCQIYYKSKTRHRVMDFIESVENHTARYEHIGDQTLSFVNKQQQQQQQQKTSMKTFVMDVAHQVLVLTHRSYNNDIRNTAYVFSYILGSIMSLFYGTLYVQVSDPSDTKTTSTNEQVVSWTSRSGIIFQILAAAVFLEQGTVASIFMEKSLFLREYGSGTYSSLAFHTSWVLRMFFTSLLKGIVYTPLFYFLSKFVSSAQPFFVLMVIISLQVTIGNALALVCAMGISTLRLATFIFALINAMASVLSGFFLTPALIPVYFTWLYYINYFKYALEGGYITQFQGYFVTDQNSGENYAVLNSIVLVNGYLDEYGNVMILMLYPVIINVIAFVVTYTRVNASSVTYETCKDDEHIEKVHVDKSLWESIIDDEELLDLHTKCIDADETEMDIEMKEFKVQ